MLLGVFMVQKNLLYRLPVLFFFAFSSAKTLEVTLSEFIRAQSQLIGSLTFGVAAEQGKRKTMEDAHSVVIGDGYGWYGVFDGHGGAEIAQLAARSLHTIARDAILNKKLNFTHLFTLFDDFLDGRPQRKSSAYEQGSTAVIALIQEGVLTVANLGDSRAVLCTSGKALRITKDHKATDPDEQSRIQAISRSLVENHEELCGIIQGYIRSEKRKNFGLAVSRALGDKAYQPCVSFIPDIFTIKIAPEDQFLILACDGLWDVISDQQAVDFVMGVRNIGITSPDEIAQKLVSYALELGSADNLTVILIMLPAFP